MKYLLCNNFIIRAAAGGVGSLVFTKDIAKKHVKIDTQVCMAAK